MASPLSLDELDARLAGAGYLADETLLTALYLALELGKPLLLEGVPGVGKTEVANRLAAILGRTCIRLQCYEGIDATKALYDWDHARQLLQVRLAEQAGTVSLDDLYDEKFLIEMPLLKALRQADRCVLLIDEIDRADDAFEAFLLELLSDFQITIPEIGTLRAACPVITILTSNRTRELHDALRRRCLYHWIDYPTREREIEILRVRVPGVEDAIAERVCTAVARLRDTDLYKLPGVGETIAWARALRALPGEDLDATLGAVLKVREDIERVRETGVLDGA